MCGFRRSPNGSTCSGFSASERPKRKALRGRISHCPLRFGCITENSFSTRSNSRTRYAFAHSRATSRRCRRSYLHISTAADHEVQCDLINPFSNVCTAEAAVKLTDGSRLIAEVHQRLLCGRSAWVKESRGLRTPPTSSVRGLKCRYRMRSRGWSSSLVALQRRQLHDGRRTQGFSRWRGTGKRWQHATSWGLTCASCAGWSAEFKR